MGDRLAVEGMKFGDTQYTKWVFALANQLRRAFYTYTGHDGTQTRILYYVLLNDKSKDIYQKDIEEEFNIRSASVSGQLKKLEEHGMITREKVPYDDRLKKIQSTELAKGNKEKIDYDIVFMEKKLSAGISEDDLRIFYKVVRMMFKNIS